MRFDYFLESIPEEDRYDVIERAAIQEFDGGATRPVAERRAIQEYKERHERRSRERSQGFHA